MTREEAIRYLEQHKYPNTCGQKSLMESNEAIDMAIEALQTAAVRRNECKHYRAEYGSCTAEHWDLSRVTFPHVDQNDYCSYWENKK